MPHLSSPVDDGGKDLEMIACNSNQAGMNVYQKAISSWVDKPRGSIFFAKFDLSSHNESSENVAVMKDKDTRNDNDEKEEGATISMCNAILSDLVNKLPPQTVLFVAVQAGISHSTKLQKEKQARSDPRASLPWSSNDQEELDRALDICRNGWGCWIGMETTATIVGKTNN